jgi:ABC-type methionine transport system ATPase subunit
MIELDRVTRRFEGKRQVVALDNVSLTIARGEMVSIIGRQAPVNPRSSI